MAVSPLRTSKRAGFTLVELLVVITIIGILMGLLLPAVNAAREAMRRLQCKNNLYQIGNAAQQHVTKLGYFPSGGWGYMWTGDPDMGFGAKQPGGWLYSTLPFLGLESIREVGRGLSDKKAAMATMRASVVPTYICPTRRRVIGYPPSESSFNANQPSTFSKTDYAGNGGSIIGAHGLTTGPGYDCLQNYPNCGDWAPDFECNGVVNRRSEVQPGHIKDGLSQTIYAAEKYLSIQFHYTGSCCADNNSAYEGYDWDIDRWVPSADGGGGDRKPLRDVLNGENCTLRFGSSHPSGFQAVFCDGSVHHFSYSIDMKIYGQLGIRNDGSSVDVSKL